MKQARVVEMTTTRAEFLRLLPAAVGHAAFVDEGCRICGDGWRILLEPLPDLALGAIRLQRQRVALKFDGFNDEAVETFLARFELHFRRGGG